MWTRAAAQGSAEAARDLVKLLRRASPDSVIHAAQWAVGGVSLDDPEPVAWLLDTLHEVAATAAVTRLAIRAATYANLDSVALVAC